MYLFSENVPFSIFYRLSADRTQTADLVRRYAPFTLSTNFMPRVCACFSSQTPSRMGMGF